MKCKVQLKHIVEMYVEGPSEEAIYEWLLFTTPQEAKEMSNGEVVEYFDEEILCAVEDDSEVDYIIEE